MIANKMLPILLHTENNVFSEKYMFESTLYLMSVMSQCYLIIIDRGISAPGQGIEVVYGLNAVDNH